MKNKLSEKCSSNIFCNSLSPPKNSNAVDSPKFYVVLDFAFEDFFEEQLCYLPFW